uniref:Uncharacterized protein n=1 Tax=Leersia perrieri TaxID=77586 RepID=A0A0D9W447_9ORYZ
MRTLVVFCVAVAFLAAAAAAATTNETAWRRVEDIAAEWELPVDAAGELLYTTAISPGALRFNGQSCVGGRCAGNGGRGYQGRGCYRVNGCQG